MRRRLERPARLFRVLIPVDMEKPFLEVGVVVSDHFQVAPEEGVIAHVETDDGCIPVYTESDRLPRVPHRTIRARQTGR